MYNQGYSGMGVNTNMYPQNVYTQGTVLPTLNTGLSGGTFQNPGGFLQPGMQGVGVGGYAAQPMYQQPMMNQPMMNQPMYQQPMMNQPMMNQPMMNQPMMNQPMMNQPTMNQPMMNQPMMGQYGAFNPQLDCSTLRNSMRGVGTDEDTIINLICQRTNSQRQQIKQYYISSYGRDLIQDLKKELSGNFENVVVAMFQTPAEFDAECLHKAMAGIGTDESVLIEIIASRPTFQLEQIKQAYRMKYNKDLVHAIEKETSGNLKKLLVSLLLAQRSQNQVPNQQQCMMDAQNLYKAGEGRWGTDESIFNQIFSTRSPAEIACINQCYVSLRGKSLEKAIDNEFSGDAKKLFMTLLKVLINPPSYFAERIHDSISGIGTKDNKLIRNIVSRCEIDMPQIKQCYRSMYGRDLLSDVRGDTSGDYKKILSGLIARF
jgi:hypothetical protein